MSSAISLPFSISAEGGIAYTTDLAKIWQDRVVLMVMTKLNERVMRPTFGTNASAVAFQNINDAMTLMRQSIAYGFTQWLNGLTLASVNGYIDPVDNNLTIEVFYNINSSNLSQSVTIKTAILSRSGDIILEVTNNG